MGYKERRLFMQSFCDLINPTFKQLGKTRFGNLLTFTNVCVLMKRLDIYSDKIIDSTTKRYIYTKHNILLQKRNYFKPDAAIRCLAQLQNSQSYILLMLKLYSTD